MVNTKKDFERFGWVWSPPQACNAGGAGNYARWTAIRDGLRECIEHLPKGHKAIENALQEAWIHVASVTAGFEVPDGGEWLIPS